MYQRRDVLKLTLGGAAALSASRIADAQTSPPETPPAAPTQPPGGGPPAPAPAPAVPAPTPAPAAGEPIAGGGVLLAPPVAFPPGGVAQMARDLAKQGFKAVNRDLPDPFKTLTPDQYGRIKLKPEARIWADVNVGFVIEPLHRGPQDPNAIDIFLVSDDKAYRLVYDLKLYDFDKLKPNPKMGDIGFGGFRVLAKADDDLAEVASFRGANFFHALATGQVPGLIARALSLKIGDPKGEEMPVFKALYIHKPSLVDNLIVVDALLDSESIAGAFRFTIRPGGATIIDTECTLVPRAYLDNYGIATMSGTHLLGFMDHKKFDDYRPNVSEICGLQMLTGAEEWVWRPVTNRETLQISTFVDNKPRGFGCVIRDRNFQDYVDEEQHWEKRPSLWIEPLGDWAEGGVQLIEIPSQSDANDNILCFWRPKEPLKPGTETTLAYRQFWCWDPPETPDLARTVRSHAGSAGNRRRFFVEFHGDILADAERTPQLSQTLTATAGSITMTRTFTTQDKKGFHILFELDPGGADSSELRLQLQAQGKPVSETWLYRWSAV